MNRYLLLFLLSLPTVPGVLYAHYMVERGKPSGVILARAGTLAIDPHKGLSACNQCSIPNIRCSGTVGTLAQLSGIHVERSSSFVIHR